MLFIDNKYTKWYFNIISNAKLRILDTAIYYEKHHIIPKSLGGNNKKDNLIYLTAREHYIVHLLLPFMIADKEQIIKMHYAVICMTSMKNSYTTQRHINPGASRFYEKSRNELSKIGRSLEHSRKISISLTGKVCSEETKEKLRNINLGKTHSNEAKKKISESSKGKKQSEETIRKRIETRIRNRQSLE